MKIAQSTRRPIRYAVFIGVLVGSVVSSTGAFAVDPIAISTQAELEAIGIDGASRSRGYVLANDINLAPPTLGTSTYITGTFDGTFDGASNTISGLTKPLFNTISGSVSNLDLVTLNTGVTGEGILSNISSAGSVIDSVSASGSISSTENDSGGLVGNASGVIINSETSGTIESNGSYVGGIAGRSTGLIDNSSSSMSISSSGNYVGGLVGMASGEIIDSHATGDVETSAFGVAGGLVGFANGSSGGVSIANSYATGAVEGYRQVGGLIGLTGNTVVISDSYATGLVTGHTEVGGLLGLGGSSAGSTTTISESYASGTVHGSGSQVGGLVGSIRYNGQILDSYTTGDVVGVADVGGIAGVVNNSVSITNVASTGDIQATEIVGGIVGTYNSTETLTNVSSFGSVTASDHGAGGLVGVLWSGNISGYRALATVVDTDPDDNGNLSDTFNGRGVDRLIACDCRGVASPTYGNVLTGDVFDPTEYINIEAAPSEDTPEEDAAPTEDADDLVPTNRTRLNREMRELTEVRSPEKIEQTIGFKNESPLPKNSAISFVNSTEKIELAKVKVVEIAATANVRVNAKADEALQISLKSESKEPVELWVKSPDGTWLLAGVITFDKDGKAILPPLRFKNVGDYTLLLNKPSVDSAKGSAPLNQSGSVLVAVS